MPNTYFDRLSVSDAGMLALENHDAHMHMGGASIFDAGPLWTPETGLDIDLIEKYVVSCLHRIPRYRQRLEYTPIDGQPIWVDDNRFNIHYHVRHTRLPQPASVRQLKRLVGRILSQQLERGKPLWEMWFVDGLEGGRFALITKIHHCMVDGVSGVELMNHLMREDTDTRVEPPHPWLARNRPGTVRLLADSLLQRPASILRDGRSALQEPRQAISRLRDYAAGLGETVLANRSPASFTPLNVDIGPHRRFDWTQMQLADVKEVRRGLGGTINDVVLAVAAGALGKFLQGRGVEIADLDFRAAIPVSTWAHSGAQGELGNHTSFLIARLPIAERDPAARLRQVVETTEELKGSRMALGQEAMAKIGEWTLPGIYTGMTRLGALLRPFNVVISNIRGPSQPSFLLGARQHEIYPAIPNFPNQALTIGLFSYQKDLFWGFNADWDSIPDLHDLVDAVDSEFELLRKAAASVPAGPRRGKRKAPKKPRA